MEASTQVPFVPVTLYLPTAGFGGKAVGAGLAVGTWLVVCLAVVCLGVVGTAVVVGTISSEHSVTGEKGKQTVKQRHGMIYLYNPPGKGGDSFK